MVALSKLSNSPLGSSCISPHKNSLIASIFIFPSLIEILFIAATNDFICEKYVAEFRSLFDHHNACTFQRTPIYISSK
jgi:hypothetical protein